MKTPNELTKSSQTTTHSCYSKLFYPFAKPTGSTPLLELSMAKKFVVIFSQGVQTQTVTILYSEIKNFLNKFHIMYGLLCPNTYNNIWGGVVLGWFGCFIVYFFKILYIHTSSLRSKWLWH